jgi:hypothetical protein
MNHAAQIVENLLDGGESLTLLDVYGGSMANIDRDEGIFNEVGTMHFKVPLPVYKVPWQNLPNLKSQDGELSVHDAYEMWSDHGQTSKVNGMVKSFRKKEFLHPWDIIVLDGDVVIDGYHRVTAAFKAKHDLRAVNLEDLPD